MPSIKTILKTAGIVVVTMAVVYRVAPARKLITNSPT
jgi:hypothetical protein